MTTDPIASALPVCTGIIYQLGVAGNLPWQESLIVRPGHDSH